MCSISSEFLALMRKVAKSPLVMDVLNIPGVQKSLERLADLLGKIQKALGEYLERERASFPRYRELLKWHTLSTRRIQSSYCTRCIKCVHTV